MSADTQHQKVHRKIRKKKKKDRVSLIYSGFVFAY